MTFKVFGSPIAQGRPRFFVRKISINCQHCGKEFYIKPSKLKENRGKYCSNKCKYARMGINQIGRKHTEETKIKLSKLKIGKPFPHEGKPKSEETKKKLRLAHLGKKMSDVTKEKIRQASLGRRHTHESRIKISLSKNGDKSNLWRGGLTEKNKLIRMSSQYRIWREKVFSRDNYTCVHCGVKGTTLAPHHIKPFSVYSELRFDISNGITLCKRCHKETDSYGKRLEAQH